MLSGLRSVWALFAGVAILQLGHGLQGSLVGVQAANASFSANTIGVIMAGFSLGMLASTLVTPRIVANVGHIRVFAAYASVASTAILLVPVWVDATWWFAMRFAAGVCMAGLSIVAESWLNSAADNTNRGKLLAVYMIVAFAAGGLGQFLLNVADASGFVRFIVVSALISLSLVPISLARSEAPAIESAKRVRLREIYSASPLAFIGTFAVGLGHQAFFAMGALYGVLNGLSLTSISIMLALPNMAVIVSQYPIGWLSDRFDRRFVLTGLALASAVIAGIILFASPLPAVALISLFGLFGAVSFPLYAMCMAHANDYLEKDQMLGASSQILLLYGVGSILGPLLAGRAMTNYGPQGFMMFMAAVYGLLGLFALYRMTARPETPDENVDYYQVAPMTSPVAAHAIAEEYVEQMQAAETASDDEPDAHLHKNGQGD